MRIEFADRRLKSGWAEDDGETYSYFYAGESALIAETLAEAAEWTGVDSERVEGIGGTVSSGYGRGPIPPRERIYDIRAILRDETHHIDIIE